MDSSPKVGPWQFREIRGGALFIEWDLKAAVKCSYCGNMFSAPSTPEGVAIVPVHDFHEMTDLDCPGSDQPGEIEDLLVS